MTPDTTDLGQAVAVAARTERLITGATCVLFDFDGPICGLFASHRAHHIADRLIAWLAERDLDVPLDESERQDPHAVLRLIGSTHPDERLVNELEQALTDEELRAVDSAAPTPHVDDLIREWSLRGVALAITTNNSPVVAARYVRRRGLTRCFDRHIYGRTTDLDLLKPDPDCLNRALGALDVDPAESLMIGDTPSDLHAARRAGVAFLGYAKNGCRVKRLREAGAEAVVESLKEVLGVLRGSCGS
ncbi:HAD family hydrolase [Streptomyces sp. CA-294286]|uniref:HAD family hydrolase n=1 Tax=Streptomyces sp. CA-294286 TaxID=3240070 RepID=UPI003D935817